MGGEGTRVLYYIVSLLAVIGLFGILTQTHLAKKIIAFLVFQAGSILFFLTLSLQGKKTASDPTEPGFGNPLPLSLVLLLIVVSLLVGLTLLRLAAHLRRREGTWEEHPMKGGPSS